MTTHRLTLHKLGSFSKSRKIKDSYPKLLYFILNFQYLNIKFWEKLTNKI